jgi:hypothetical protein
MSRRPFAGFDAAKLVNKLDQLDEKWNNDVEKDYFQ